MAGKKSGDANKQAAATAKKQQAAENAKRRGAEAEAAANAKKREAEAAANAKKRELQSKKQMAAPGTTDISPTIANGYNVRDYDWLHSVKDCPVYKPSFAEFEDPFQYIQSIAKEASEYGICKIIPPFPPSKTANVILSTDFKFKTTVQPLQANNGQIVYEEGRMRTLAQFEVQANKFMAARYANSIMIPPRLLEIDFWHELLRIKQSQVEYGINIEGSGFSGLLDDALASSAWNLKTFSKLPKCLLRHVERPIKGVTEPMMYIGMLFGTFAWHVEDNYLYSINYHHCGAPKTWYGVPGKQATLLEEIAEKEIFNNQFQWEVTSQETNGANILAKKTTMFPPNMLQDHGVMVSRATQLCGEFIVTFPRAYHAGFSNGFNIGEAVNFAPYDWIDFGNLAARNYARSGISSIVSCDQIIFKECISFDRDTLTDAERELAIHFGISLSLHKVARSCLYQSPPQGFDTIQKDDNIVLCTNCGRDCFFSYVIHEDSSDPICLLHDWSRFKGCKLYLHQDIKEIENKQSELFKKDNQLVQQVQDALHDIAITTANKWLLKFMVNVVVSL